MNEKEWREIISDRLVPECGYYYIVYDPDYVFGDERLYIQLKEKGFEILTYTDEIDFRLIFEEKIRFYTDSNVHKEVIIVVNERKAHAYIPYDLVVTCTHISVDLEVLFPSIDPEELRDGPVYVSDSGTTFDASEKSLMKRLENLAKDIPATYSGWLTFVDTWASILSSIYTEFHPNTSSELFSFLYRTKMAVNGRFEEWLEKSYGSLYNHPPSSPVMVHHLPRYISQRIEEGRKVALLVIDGLSVSQWKVIRAALGTPAVHGYSIEERALFAWIPTLTSVSRQALLSGKLPLTISRFLHDTSREEKLWKNFWEDNDISSDKVGYRKVQGDTRDLVEITALIEENFQVAALILDKVDSVMHGQKQGSVMMHQEVRHWADTAFLSDLIGILFRHYDELYLTSDHGNDEAVGIGSFSQGSLVKEKGQRCRIYTTAQFRQEAQEVYPESIPWPQIGLPENYYPLLAPYGKAFAKEGATVVTHGGASIDEVIVPFVRFTREDTHHG